MSSSTSSRLRQRFNRRLRVWRIARDYVRTCNGLHQGTVGRQTSKRRYVATDYMKAAWTDLHRRALVGAARISQGRRSLGLTGGHAVEEGLQPRPVHDAVRLHEDEDRSLGRAARRLRSVSCTSPVRNDLELFFSCCCFVCLRARRAAAVF